MIHNVIVNIFQSWDHLDGNNYKHNMWIYAGDYDIHKKSVIFVCLVNMNWVIKINTSSWISYVFTYAKILYKLIKTFIMFGSFVTGLARHFLQCFMASLIHILSNCYLARSTVIFSFLFIYAVGSKNFPAWHTKAAPNGKCSEGYIVPSMVRLMYQLKSVLKWRETMLKNSKGVLFLSP